MVHFKALGLYYKKMVAKCGAIRVKIAFIWGCLENTAVKFVRFFSTSRAREKPFSPSTIDCFFKNTFEIFI